MLYASKYYGEKLSREETEGCQGDNGCNFKLFGGVKKILRKQPLSCFLRIPGEKFPGREGVGFESQRGGP